MRVPAIGWFTTGLTMSKENNGAGSINPASGLPMLPNGSTPTDIAGNPRGQNFEREEPWPDRDEGPSFSDDLFDWSSSDW